ncbi:hypothetical protein, partial [Atopomonas sediminilitoris]|uniref:hypothetical protein n=1 Tax=Atopomonas sediminilitoris TaxID=2919919 RepID=UPI001F4EEF5D
LAQCRIRLPLMRLMQIAEFPKWLNRKKKFFETVLDSDKRCCRMRASVERTAHQPLFKNQNQAIRVGAY